MFLDVIVESLLEHVVYNEFGNSTLVFKIVFMEQCDRYL